MQEYLFIIQILEENIPLANILFHVAKLEEVDKGR